MFGSSGEVKSKEREDNVSSATTSKDSTKQLKPEDLLQYSNIFASEFNNSNLHDRVLVFQVTEEVEFVAPSTDLSENGIEDLPTIQTSPPQDYPSGPTNSFVPLATNKNTTCPEAEPTITSSEGSLDIPGKDGLENDVEVSSSPSNSTDSAGCTEREEKSEDVSCQTDSKSNAEVETERERDQIKLESKSSLLKHGDDEVTRPFSKESDESEDVRSANEKEDEIEKGSDKEDENDEHISSADQSVTEHKIFVHGSWLAVQSPYFRALLYSGMKETHSKEVIMRVTEKELIPHLTLIEAMYKPDVLDDKDYDLVLDVLALANKYDVALVFKKCKYVLLDMPLSLEVCESILATVNGMLNTEDLLSFLENFLVHEFKPLDTTWRMDKFTNLSEAALRLLISSDHLAVLSENTVFVALMHWLEDNDPTSSSSLLSLVRFELMTADFLYDVVQHHYLAKKISGFEQLLLNGFSYHSFSAERKNKLEIKPVSRAEYNNENQPTFTWLIDGDTKKKAAASKVYSEHFWWRGYEMYLSLFMASNLLCNIFTYVVFPSQPPSGYLRISWEIVSSLFKPSQKIENSFTGLGSVRRIKCRCSVENTQEHETDTIEVNYINFKP